MGNGRPHWHQRFQHPLNEFSKFREYLRQILISFCDSQRKKQNNLIKLNSILYYSLQCEYNLLRLYLISAKYWRSSVLCVFPNVGRGVGRRIVFELNWQRLLIESALYLYLTRWWQLTDYAATYQMLSTCSSNVGVWWRESKNFHLRVRTVAKRHMRSSMFTASFILVSCVKLP